MGPNLDPGTDTSRMVFLLVGKGKPGPGVDRMRPPDRAGWWSRQARPPGHRCGLDGLDQPGPRGLDGLDHPGSASPWSGRGRPPDSVSTGSTNRACVVSTGLDHPVTHGGLDGLDHPMTGSTTRGPARPPGRSVVSTSSTTRLGSSGSPTRGLVVSTGLTTRPPWSRRARPPDDGLDHQ